MRKVDFDRLAAFLDAINQTTPLYLPVTTSTGTYFDRWDGTQEVVFRGNPARGIKDFFFPQTEDLMKLRREGKTVEVIDTRREAEDFVVFGAHMCDVRAMDILDEVFLAEPVDTYYATRREHGLIVTLACNYPALTCFCTTFGIDPAEPAGDVAAWVVPNGLCLEARTEKGAVWLSLYDAYTEASDSAAVEEQKTITREKLDKLPLVGLTPDAFGGDTLKKHFESDKWAKLSEACLGCGTCTFVCPTCQCYDIRDFDTGHGIERFRCWDSCMYSDFTKMAHGNSRLTQLERFRQRFMHKLVYYPAEHEGTFGCVGCGRCLAKCPQSLHIVKVMRALGKEERHEK